MKYCSYCGAQLPDDVKFCFSCGTATANPVDNSAVSAPASEAVPPPPPPSTAPPAPPIAPVKKGRTKKKLAYDNEVLMQGVQLCEDGKYRWIYALNMWTNPSILILIFKIFFWIFVGIWALMVIIMLCEDGWNGEAFWDATFPMLILLGVFTVIALISYAIVAAMYGGKYTVLFTMDEQCIIHEQIPEQAKKAQKLGMVTAAAGVLSGKPGMVGLGISSAARTSMSSDFASVRSVKARKWRNLIKVRELLSHNQIYVHDKDFEFVYNYIKSHSPRVK